jgi:hypothetical protein
MHRARLKVVGRGSVRTGRRASPARYGCPPEQIENENDDDDEKDCPKHRLTLYTAGLVARGSGESLPPA